MARKKRKAGKAPVSASGPAKTEAGKAREWTAGERILLPALGALGLVFAWLAALGGVADGTLDFRLILDIDTVRPRIFFRELFEKGQGLSGLRQGRSSYFLPDIAVQWVLFGLGVNLAAALYLFSLAQVAIAAAGWMLVCDILFGKSPARRAAVLLLHALALLVLAWRGADVLYAHLAGLFHYGAWALLPWLLWLTLRVLDFDRRGGRGSGGVSPGPAFALAAFLAASVASDPLVVVWFVAPAGLAAVVLARTGGLDGRKCVWLVGLLAAGCVAGRGLFALSEAAGIISPKSSDSFQPERSLTALRTMTIHYRDSALHNPAQAAVWLAFAAVAARRLAAALRPKARGNGSGFLAVPRHPAHRLAAIFVPAAMLAAPAAQVAAGASVEVFSYAHPGALGDNVIGRYNRYTLPTLYFPLFVGWALLPWGQFPAFARVRAAVFAAFAAVLLASGPKWARIDAAALDPFGTPFQQCFAENAKRLNWTAGVAPLFFSNLFVENPHANIERMLPVGTFRRPQPGQSFMVVDIVWNSRISGEYQFFVLNERDGGIFSSVPLAGERPCGPDQCPVTELSNFVLDEGSVRAAFGAPAEAIDCAGVRLLHYDPPMKFDFSHREDPYLAPVARW